VSSGKRSTKLDGMLTVQHSGHTKDEPLKARETHQEHDDESHG
jgi:hypothetical protein